MVKISSCPRQWHAQNLCSPGRSFSDELVQECRYLQDKIYDVVELRIDFLKDVTSLDAVGEALTAVRQELPDSAILFTFRTKEEGGEMEVPESYYFDLIDYAVKSGKIDAIDVEYFRDRASIKKSWKPSQKNTVSQSS